MSPYITKIRNPRVRLLYTRLRIDRHCLATCKTKAKLSSNISCPLCKQGDETVEHFLLTCGHFAANRNDFYTNLDAYVSLFESLDETDKLRFILDLQCPKETFHLLQICLQNVPVKSNSVFIESLFIESILLTYWILAANIMRYQIFYLAVIWPLYMSICIVLYVCDIYVLYCVCSFSFFFLFFFCLMIGKTFVMFGYANKEFEFEFDLIWVWKLHFPELNELKQITVIRGKYLDGQCVLLVDYRVYLMHDDVIKWKHFPCNWPFVRGIHRSPVNSQHKGLWRGALMLSLICVWINDWVNNNEAGDLRRCRAHYDVVVMISTGINGVSYVWCFVDKCCSLQQK